MLQVGSSPIANLDTYDLLCRMDYSSAQFMMSECDRRTRESWKNRIICSCVSSFEIEISHQCNVLTGAALSVRVVLGDVDVDLVILWQLSELTLQI